MRSRDTSARYLGELAGITAGMKIRQTVLSSMPDNF
jgi:hypothetical protein